MAGVPASSHGSTFDGGTITHALLETTSDDPALRIRVPESVNDAIRVEDSDDANQPNFLVGALGYITATGANLTAIDNSTILGIDAHALTTRDAVNLLVTGGGSPFRLSTLGYLIIATHSAPGDDDLGAGDCALWFDQTNGASALGLKGKSANGTVLTSTHPLRQSSGALPTVAPVSGAAFQCSLTQDVLLTVPVTYNPGVATTATCKVELSPDNVTFSTLVTVTQPVGTVFDGSIESVQLIVPAAWRVKLTVVNATLGTGTYY